MTTSCINICYIYTDWASYIHPTPALFPFNPWVIKNYYYCVFVVTGYCTGIDISRSSHLLCMYRVKNRNGTIYFIRSLFLFRVFLGILSQKTFAICRDWVDLTSFRGLYPRDFSGPPTKYMCSPSKGSIHYLGTPFN